MKNSLSLKEIEIAVKDPQYLKHQNHKKLIAQQENRKAFYSEYK
jgi:hypothetical protein